MQVPLSKARGRSIFIQLDTAYKILQQSELKMRKEHDMTVTTDGLACKANTEYTLERK